MCGLGLGGQAGFFVRSASSAPHTEHLYMQPAGEKTGANLKLLKVQS